MFLKFKSFIKWMPHCLFLCAVALFLILLSTLMIWTNIEQRSLFGIYMIQVCFSRVKIKIFSAVWAEDSVIFFLQAASVSLQGFLNSMVYAWRRPNFTEAVFGENTPLVAQQHLAFFDESLRSSFWLQTLNVRSDILCAAETTSWPEAAWPRGCTLHVFEWM